MSALHQCTLYTSEPDVCVTQRLAVNLSSCMYNSSHTLSHHQPSDYLVYTSVYLNHITVSDHGPTYTSLQCRVMIGVHVCSLIQESSCLGAYIHLHSPGHLVSLFFARITFHQNVIRYTIYHVIIAMTN